MRDIEDKTSKGDGGYLPATRAEIVVSVIAITLFLGFMLLLSAATLSGLWVIVKIFV